MFRKVEQELGRKIPDALKKLSGGKWEWEPTIGDRVCRGEMILFYAGIIPAINGKRAGKFISEAGTQYEWPISLVIPLLYWERIEEILEEMGYDKFKFSWHQLKDQFVICDIRKDDKLICAQAAKSRQEAVQRAILALVEEKEK